ncbi:MAG: class I SAM-dependent methyltransferase [Verrucomicrobiaceae bacterium]|nr:class I SAM-dependent methyltransferase [Verrucomicrobiaceae bacterium]
MTQKCPCHDCQSEDVIVFEEYERLTRVTSDCKPWPAGGSLQLCRSCGLLQSGVNPFWIDEITRIYAEYDCHYQSGGVDQAVYDPKSGQPIKRSDKLLGTLVERMLLPPARRLVDVGCGSGAFLAACGQHLPGWELVGLEQAAKYEEKIRSLPGVVDFQPVSLDKLTGEYALMTMIHVLEHIPAPAKNLATLSRQLVEDGVFFIQVPSYEENPFELVVADHSAHFSGRQLLRVIRAAGSHAKHEEQGWLPKELSLVASKCGTPEREKPSEAEIEETASFVRQRLQWLEMVSTEARKLMAKKPFSIFGTSIAANWLLGVIGADAVDFFVDEDPGRKGLKHCGKPIITPDQIPDGATVFVPLAPAVAASVHARLSNPRFSLVVPGL